MNSEDKTIDQQSTRWNNKILITVFVGLLFGSNILNTYVNNQIANTAAITRNEAQRLIDDENMDEANRRRLGNLEEKMTLESEIIMLEYRLEVCNEK